MKIVTDLNDLPTFSPDKPVFLDIETEKLYVKTRLIQLYQPATDDTVYIIDIAPDKDEEARQAKEKQMVEYLKPLWLVAYNASYDLGTMNFVPKRIDDLFYAVKTAYPQFIKFSLDTVAAKFNQHQYEGIDKKILQKKGFKPGEVLTDEMLRYSAADVEVLHLLWQDKRVQAVVNHNLAYKVDILSLRYAVEYQQNGSLVDRAKVKEEIDKAEAEVERLQAKLPEGLNVNSPKQVKEYLGTTGSSKDVLLRCPNPDAKVILELKKRRKELSYLKSIDHDKMFTKFNPAGAASGRFSASGGDLPQGYNAQQIPRAFRYLFKQDTSDTAVVYLDYSNLEARVAAALWGIKNMRKFFLEGKDLHTIMAQQITKKKVHPDGVIKGHSNEYVTNTDRTNAKAANFGFLFGLSAKSFVDYAFNGYGINVSLEEAAKFRDAFFSLYPEAEKHHRYVWSNYEKPGFVIETALGRRIKPKLGTDGINISVQGTGAETTKLAVHYLIKEHSKAIKYIENIVHDSIQLRVPKDEKDYWEEELRTAMLKGWSEISKTRAFKFKDIPMEVSE